VKKLISGQVYIIVYICTMLTENVVGKGQEK